jgi:predicted amidophosphoribosyltransferase
MAELLWECEAEALQEIRADVIIPVPQHWIRRIYRPHHAAETLAAAWATRLQVPLATHILRKRRWTGPQARLSPSERRVNLRNAFGLASSAGLAGAVVLLADDVMTTGTTAHETAKVLTQAGAARVVVAVVARGMGRR